MSYEERIDELLAARAEADKALRTVCKRARKTKKFMNSDHPATKSVLVRQYAASTKRVAPKTGWSEKPFYGYNPKKHYIWMREAVYYPLTGCQDPWFKPRMLSRPKK